MGGCQLTATLGRIDTKCCRSTPAHPADIETISRPCVECFRRAQSVYEAARFKPRGLERTGNYRVTALSRINRVLELTGAEMMDTGLGGEAPRASEAVVLVYQHSNRSRAATRRSTCVCASDRARSSSMSGMDWVVARNLGLCVLIVVVFYALFVVWDRERIKRHLTERGCTVRKLRWKPFTWWGPFHGHSFAVEYVDLLGFIHRGKCWTYGFPFKIVWHQDEVTGRNADWPL